jgi:hypothetical protein
MFTISAWLLRQTSFIQFHRGSARSLSGTSPENLLDRAGNLFPIVSRQRNSHGRYACTDNPNSDRPRFKGSLASSFAMYRGLRLRRCCHNFAIIRLGNSRLAQFSLLRSPLCLFLARSLRLCVSLFLWWNCTLNEVGHKGNAPIFRADIQRKCSAIIMGVMGSGAQIDTTASTSSNHFEDSPNALFILRALPIENRNLTCGQTVKLSAVSHFFFDISHLQASDFISRYTRAKIKFKRNMHRYRFITDIPWSYAIDGPWKIIWLIMNTSTFVECIEHEP